MNLSISRDSLSHLLYLTNTIVERRNTMPILANVRITAENGKVSIAATDLEISLVGEAEAEVRTPGTITVAAKMLYEIVKEMPEKNVGIQLGKNNRIEIQSGQSRFKINGISADEFPAIMGTTIKNPISVDAAKLFEMLDKTAFAVSTDETRYNINGVYVETVDNRAGQDKQSLRLVATDGHRLALIDRPADGLSLKSGVIIPKKGIQELKKVLEENDGAASVSINEGFFTVQSAGVTIGIRLVDGQFPDYKQVIPIENTATIEANRNDLLAAVRRVSLVTTDKSRAVKFKLLDGTLTVSSSSPEYGEASESITVSQKGDGVTIGFSARYVLDLLNAMQPSEAVSVKFNGDLGPAVFNRMEDEFYTCIVMPMRFE